MVAKRGQNRKPPPVDYVEISPERLKGISVWAPEAAGLLFESTGDTAMETGLFSVRELMQAKLRDL
jgi:hypothetical protein